MKSPAPNINRVTRKPPAPVRIKAKRYEVRMIDDMHAVVFGDKVSSRHAIRSAAERRAKDLNEVVGMNLNEGED